MLEQFGFCCTRNTICLLKFYCFERNCNRHEFSLRNINMIDMPKFRLQKTNRFGLENFLVGIQYVIRYRL